MTNQTRKEYLKKRTKVRKARTAKRKKKRAIKEWVRRKRLRRDAE